MLGNDGSLPAQQLPTILCLHGAGTNGRIFRLQARMLVRNLASRFHFLFLDAPFESLPGPGCMPTYAGMQPYLWWHCDESSADHFDVSVDEVRRRRQEVRKLLCDKLQDTNVVGIMAFSQGARVATGICLDDQLGRHIKFIVLIAATFPALPVNADDVLCQESSSTIVTPAANADLGTPTRNRYITIPSVHVQGALDPWLPEGKQLRSSYFAESEAEVVVFSGAHTVPVKRQDVDNVVKTVLAAWEKGKCCV